MLLLMMVGHHSLAAVALLMFPLLLGACRTDEPVAGGASPHGSQSQGGQGATHTASGGSGGAAGAGVGGASCSHGSDCSDDNPCTTDTCKPTQTCSNVPLPDGTACNDGDASTSNDQCIAGVCAGFPPQPCDELPAGATHDVAVSFTANGSEIQQASQLSDLFGAWPIQPNLVNQTFRVYLKANQYLSLPFEIPPETDPSAYLAIVWEADTSSSGGTVVSVSECIGGVLPSQSVPQSGGATSYCHKQGVDSGGGIRIGRDPQQANCVLEAGKRYFLNVMDYRVDTEEVTCGAVSCTWLVQPSGGVPGG